MSIVIAVILLMSLFAVEVVYFKLADQFNIIDKPNHRSSHTYVTIRGGGIIFPIGAILFFFCFGFQYPFFIAGLFAIAFISFLDDIHTLNNKVRLSVHLLSVLLLFYQWDLFEYPWYWIIIALIFVIGTINAYNFMDGINGITGSYSFLAIIMLFYINSSVTPFTSSSLLIAVGLSLIVFNFFNFRNKAKCFAGDVGSISIAFIVIFLIGQLILKTSNFNYILLLLVYGLDAVVTIGFRVLRKENIFEAHRSHFYQYLSNELKWPHLYVSILYFVVQAIINFLLIFVIKESLSLCLGLIVLSAIVFLATRFLVEGRSKLLSKA
ncbi:UDP-GlcNAc--UDP-phosphate GlcNAc-1-phosphate transferase [Pedobacter yonginense]|uniref:UDP-GlcNAc--UDP-phosphate GlcNAc-1-phosphate transferase n=1 Tax=Pedobacter yonginense TaxID=651869 RepID=A0A317ENJ8_9SPHI|nr:glycosyltransferase family 4 protein [Pedobacter yonginense]PWS28194.1 UDP-GlcNAc--UDP-phosphate GlcNAc-1-phosphate transferase [Pedobacter yonginense]